MKEETAKKGKEAQLRQILGSPEARRLMQLLSRGGESTLRQAAEAAGQGDTATAQAMLKPLLENPEAAALLKKLSGGQ